MNALLRPKVLLAFLLATVLGYTPMVSVLVAERTAWALGCKLNEADAHPCFLWGWDGGELLYGLFVVGWLMLGTWPLMLAMPLVWTTVGLLALHRAWRRKARHAPPDR